MVVNGDDGFNCSVHSVDQPSFIDFFQRKNSGVLLPPSVSFQMTGTEVVDWPVVYGAMVNGSEGFALTVSLEPWVFEERV